MTKRNGRDPAERARRLKAAAELALQHGGRGLEAVLALDTKAARKVLKQFPGIGEPGADKILSACGAAEGLALESNGLRVLLRLGYGSEASAYGKTYRSVIEGVAVEAEKNAKWAWRAHRLLRTHGREVCKSSTPRCTECPLAADCVFARNLG